MSDYLPLHLSRSLPACSPACHCAVCDVVWHFERAVLICDPAEYSCRKHSIEAHTAAVHMHAGTVQGTVL